MSLHRIDTDTTHGWQARAKVGGQIKGLTMLCSDSVHGGPEKAHRAAKAAEKLLQLRADAIRRVHVLRGLQKVERAMNDRINAAEGRR